MKPRILNLALILTSFIGYLEWGEGRSMFLVQGELEVLAKLLSDPMSVLHPFTMLPLAGQLALAITLFQKTPNRWLTIFGMVGIGLLLVLVFAIGLMTLNVGIAASAVPFLVTVALVVREMRRASKPMT